MLVCNYVFRYASMKCIHVGTRYLYGAFRNIREVKETHTGIPQRQMGYTDVHELV